MGQNAEEAAVENVSVWIVGGLVGLCSIHCMKCLYLTLIDSRQSVLVYLKA